MTHNLIQNEKQLPFLDIKKWPELNSEEEKYQFGKNCARRTLEFLISCVEKYETNSLSLSEFDKILRPTLNKVNKLFSDQGTITKGWYDQIDKMNAAMQTD